MQQEADTYMVEQARFESAEDAKELVATEVQNQLAKVGTLRLNTIVQRVN